MSDTKVVRQSLAHTLTTISDRVQQSKVYAKAIAAFDKAAHGQERLNSPWHAAKHLEKAAECCKVHSHTI